MMVRETAIARSVASSDAVAPGDQPASTVVIFVAPVPQIISVSAERTAAGPPGQFAYAILGSVLLRC
jgi:hypothetical protein